MHYYPFNIGDYSSHTSRLSLIEDLAYRRLLDLYYLTERPFNGCSTDVARDIGLQDHQKEVDYILGKFFPKVGDDWVNDRCKREVDLYQSKKITASKAGKASAEARKTKASEQTFNDRSTTVQPNNKQELRTKNQEPLKDIGAKAPAQKSKFIKPTPEEIHSYLLTKKIDDTAEAEKIFDYYESKGWVVGKAPMKDWKATVRNWIKNYKKPAFGNNQPAQQEGAKFRPYVHEKTERTAAPEGMIDDWRKLL